MGTIQEVEVLSSWMATIKHRLKKQLPAEISGARRSQGWMELEEISKDTGEVSESCCRRLVLVG